MKILAPFGPKIAKFKISKSIIKRMNDEVEKISKNKRLGKKYNYSNKLVGHVSKEIELSKNFIDKNLKKIISSSVKNFIKKTCGKNTNKIKIKNLWVVSQYSSEFNPVHYHSGHISGVGYLKLPKNFSTKKNKVYGSIDFINGNKMFLSESIHNHVPKVGDVILFPNYLMHTAYPFNSDGERRSFSFNIEIDQEIANVFSR
tara:strand:+ start:886 stop:1488 length:603 start_codon:yes stop_codon:yes gene_type:complete